ncbi:hypothetical protein CRM22_010546 [Opisthorchis felineus]|uniref:J domain-containing protein n=1 Tax=Opisthorchis felineus TaxID=147828 RepID=A0A4S2KXN1_OPIFE|nr:hypothetical protein CRM22_010546 [Opisthorchis felineus]
MLSDVWLFRLILLALCLGRVLAGLGEIYCGEDNCYDLLQVSRDDDRAFIRKSYRKLAREHHPDRQQTPSAKAEAELHLRKLNIAYDILMDEEQRRDYDYMLDHPEETYFHYYRYYRHRYSPKIDVRIVIAIIVTVLCVIQYIGQWTSYNHALTYLARDPKHRAKAREIASADGLLSVRRKDNGARFTREELKDREEAILRDIISRTVDLRGDCAKPSLRRLFICQLVLLPYTCYCWLLWAFKWIWVYWILRQPYDEAAKVFLTRRRLGMSEAQWDGLDEERRDAFMKKQLWDPVAFQAYTQAKAEEMRILAAQSGQQKRYRRYIRNTGGPKQFSMEDFDF